MVHDFGEDDVRTGGRPRNCKMPHGQAYGQAYELEG